MALERRGLVELSDKLPIDLEQKRLADRKSHLAYLPAHSACSTDRLVLGE
jgi:hypothetical protein